MSEAGKALVLIRGCLCPVVILFRLIHGRRFRPVIPALFWSRASAPLGRATPSPPVPVPVPVPVYVPVAIITVPVPVSVALTLLVSVIAITATTRTTGAVTVTTGRRRPPVVTPDRRGGILCPLNAQTRTLKMPPMHVIVRIFSIALATEFDKGITARGFEGDVERGCFRAECGTSNDRDGLRFVYTALRGP